MYYKEIRVWVPSEKILNVQFLKHEKFFVYLFLNKPYIITANIASTRNFIGFGADGNIYLLDRVNNREIYASSALAVFARQLKLYRDFEAMEQNEENISQSEDLIEQIQKLDENAFSDENSFWSKALKKSRLEYLIYEVEKW